MKFPKHRANCYIVERHIYKLHSDKDTYAVLGVFPTYDGADAFKDACKQEWKDKGLLDETNYLVEFQVNLSTFYDA